MGQQPLGSCGACAQAPAFRYSDIGPIRMPFQCGASGFLPTRPAACSSACPGRREPVEPADRSVPRCGHRLRRRRSPRLHRLDRWPEEDPSAAAAASTSAPSVARSLAPDRAAQGASHIPATLAGKHARRFQAWWTDERDASRRRHFQANLTQARSAELPKTSIPSSSAGAARQPRTVRRIHRHAGPTCRLDFPRILLLHDGQATRPIRGRVRAPPIARRRRLAESFWRRKDRRKHHDRRSMRNDFRVCLPKTVERRCSAGWSCAIASSCVGRGRLKPGLDALHLMAACSGGSITGAPRSRDGDHPRHEPGRAVSCGSIVHFGYDRSLRLQHRDPHAWWRMASHRSVPEVSRSWMRRRIREAGGRRMFGSGASRLAEAAVILIVDNYDLRLQHCPLCRARPRGRGRAGATDRRRRDPRLRTTGLIISRGLAPDTGFPPRRCEAFE